MSSKAHRKNCTRRYCVRVLDRDVFSELCFPNEHERDIVYDSYVQNIDILIEYAAKSNVSIIAYFREIKDILLQSKNIHERTK